MTKRLLALWVTLFLWSLGASSASAASLSADLNGDGKSDLVWYNGATGQTSYWLMNGGSLASAAVLLTDANWKVVATGDLNGDGKSDLIWYNAATGQTSYWLMNGGAILSTGLLLTDANWRVIGTGDLNGDGKADIVWYNPSTGQTSYWLMNGASPISTGLLLTHAVWTVVAVGDLDGDGKADLVWYNRDTGQTSYWLMNGGAVLAANVLLAHPAWKVTALADLNGDGKSDLIWFNATTGQTSYWLMNGGSVLGTGLLLTDANWKVVNAADLNGDGKSDLIWFNAATGQTSYWLMNGGTLSSAAVLLSDASWKVAVPGSNLNSALLSADQAAFENLILAPGGSHAISWNLNYSGPETSGTNYAWTDYAVLPLSPLTFGPQTTVQAPPTNLTSTLALPAEAPGRYLKNGTILVVASQNQANRASYSGSDVQIDYLAADRTTIAWSQLRRSYSTVSLSGIMAGSTDDFAHYYNSFFSNAAILKSGVSYLPNAGYVKFRAYVKGDRYGAFDCNAVTSDVNISPCYTGTTLTAALTSGIASSSDATTYHLADGAIKTVGGVQIWVATAPRPVSATLSLTSQYRIYFELNGNVYTGALLPDGSPITTSYYVSNPAGSTALERLTFLDYQVRLNQAARDSLLAAMNL